MAYVTKRGNSYLIRSSAGYDIHGKQIRRSRTWTPGPKMTPKQIQKELERQKVLLDEETSIGLQGKSNIKFQDFAEEWFKEYAVTHLKRKTLFEVQGRATERIYPAIGNIRLSKLKPQHLMRFYDQLSNIKTHGSVRYKSGVLRKIRKERELSVAKLAEEAHVATSTITYIETGHSCLLKTAEQVSNALGMPMKDVFAAVQSEGQLSPKTIHLYHEVISSILERAVKWQIISENPCRRVDPPKVSKHTIQALSDVQAEKFMEQLHHESLEDRTFFSLALYTGMRRGELLGLEWPDIDFETGVVSIVRTSQYQAGVGMYEDTPKTERSKRSIHITETMLDLLRVYRAWQSERRLSMGDQWFSEWNEHPRIFTNQNGSPMTSSTPLTRLKRILKRADLPPVLSSFVAAYISFPFDQSGS